MKTGYLHPKYAKSFEEFGIPYELARCGGWIIKRRVPGFPYFDAMGCYPLFFCHDWSKLYDDLDDIGTDLISLSVVPDPFGDFDKNYLKKCFKAVVIPFKEHFIIDLSRSMNSFVSDHHLRYARKALQSIYVEKCKRPIQFLNECVELYTNLIKRHNIKGILAFSRLAFAKQLTVPGIVVFRAVHEGKTVGMLLWYTQGEVGYYHLGASSEIGYKLRASFALFRFSLEYFANFGLKWLNLGAGAGVKSNGMDGLSQFKRGWSTETSTVYFCGRIFDRKKYAKIVTDKGIASNDYFPAYRRGEFF